ncbi:hypothetical protein BDD12DRAFT_871652 [Trichophaea hybrida]|nr:hypothetical protein BDD12DRAFT_871652 [Trichophaea hybrida]
METVTLAVAIPKLLILVSQSIIEINCAVDYYRKINKNLFNTLNRLATETKSAECLIKLAQETAASMENKNLYQVIMGYIQCIQNIIEEVSTTLSEFDHKPSKPNPIGTKGNPIASALDAISKCLSQKAGVMPTERRLQLSHRRKLKLVFHKTPKHLDDLLEDLRKQNNTLNLRLFSGHFTNNQTAPKDPFKTSNASTAIGRSVTAIAQESEVEEDQQQHEQQPQQLENYKPRNSQKNQLPLPTMLYQTLAKKLRCRCHLLHLGLEIQRKIQNSNITGPDGSQQIEFSAFVTPSIYPDPKFNDTSTLSRTTCELQLEIVDTLSNNTQPLSCCIDNLCEALFVQQQEQMEYLLEDFLVRRVPQFKRAQSENALSLHDLSEGKRHVTLYDRLKLAVKLGRAALLLHSSPWISEWNSQTIVFFVQYEESRNIADWRPHVSAILNPNYTLHAPNTDIYALGMILLEFGGADMDEYRKQAPLSDMEPALTKVMREQGVQYRKVAECCFNIYKDSQERNMDAFRAEIGNLERHVTECFEF